MSVKRILDELDREQARDLTTMKAELADMESRNPYMAITVARWILSEVGDILTADERGFLDDYAARYNGDDPAQKMADELRAVYLFVINGLSEALQP